MKRVNPRTVAAAAVLLCAAVVARCEPAFLVPFGATWRYLDDGSDPGTNWTALAFNDSGWASGPAELGYGDGDEATEVSFGPNASAKYVTTYFRHAFEVADPAAWQGDLLVKTVRDDGVVIYLNGEEVLRDNMPAGPITYTTYASGGAGGSDEFIAIARWAPAAALRAGTNVLAAEVHQDAGNSSDISFNLSLVAHNPIIRGPYLQQATPESIRILWKTQAPADSRVMLGDSPTNLTRLVESSRLTIDHEVVVTGLTAATRYYYTAGSSAGTYAGPDTNHTFETPPFPWTRGPTRIWAVGDSGTANPNAAAVRNAYAAYAAGHKTDLWLMLGDNAYLSGLDIQYQSAVFDMYPELLRSVTLWPTFGNHESYGGASSITQTGPYYDIFSLPRLGEAGGMPSGTEAYYSFDYANIHFLCLNSMDISRAPGGVMASWVQADLASTAADWIIAFWHHPPYTKGSHNSDVEIELVQMRQNLLPILEAYGVDLVLCGHSHSYERSFLLHGHYGTSPQLQPSMILDGGDGRVAGDGAYSKHSSTGAVYVVAGSSGLTSGGALNHPVMFVSLNELGSLSLDVASNRLDATFLNAAGAVRDTFRILKDLPADTRAPAVAAVTATGRWDRVEVVFDENVRLGAGEGSAEDPSLYAVPGFGIQDASLRSAYRVATLALDGPLQTGVVYAVTVSNVFDWATPANVLPPTSVNFTYTPSPPVVDNAGGATEIGSFSARLNGVLVSETTGSPTSGRIYYGTTNGTIFPHAWERWAPLDNLQEGVFSAAVTGLTEASTYYYRCVVSNAFDLAWAAASSEFRTRSRLTDWAYRMPVRIQADWLSAPLTNFPALIMLDASIPDFRYRQFSLPDGADLRLTDEDRQVFLDLSIDEWNTNGQSLVWVKVPVLVPGSNTLWAFWGNPGADPLSTAARAATWSEDFRGVYHLSETGTGTRTDSSPYANHGTPGSFNGSEKRNGMIGLCDRFDGISKHILVHDAASLDLSTQITVSAWVRSERWDQDNVIVRKDRAYRFYNRWDDTSASHLTLKIPNLFPAEEAGYPIVNLPTGRWYHVCGTYDRDAVDNNLKVYVDGEQVAAETTDGLIPQTADDLYIGIKVGGTQPFAGLIDEVRIASAARSADWVRACWRNVVSNGMFVQTGAVTLSPEPDADGDGLPDPWEERHFVQIAGGVPDEDSDHDGMNNEAEFAAGTDPTNAASVLRFTGLEPGAPGKTVLIWSSESNRYYAVGVATNLQAPFQPLLDLPATPPENRYTNDVSGPAGRAFYRLRLNP